MVYFVFFFILTVNKLWCIKLCCVISAFMSKQFFNAYIFFPQRWSSPLWNVSTWQDLQNNTKLCCDKTCPNRTAKFPNVTKCTMVSIPYISVTLPCFWNFVRDVLCYSFTAYYCIFEFCDEFKGNINEHTSSIKCSFRAIWYLLKK